MSPALHSDEAQDAPLVTMDLVYLLGVVLLVPCFAIGVGLCSWLLHTWDAEIRSALYWAWEHLEPVLWAALALQG